MISALALALALAAPPSYTGTLAFRGLQPSEVTVVLSGSRAVVSLGPAHAAHDVVPVRSSGDRIRFSLPGRPSLAFDLRRQGSKLGGSVRQGALVGTVSARRGTSADSRLGFFSGPVEVVRFTQYGSSEPVAVDLGTGAFSAPSRLGARADVRQLEVRLGTLGGTLTLPPGPGPFPAAVYVSGSGPTLREEAQYFGGLLVAHGIAVLAYDKRGVGESGGHYPGSLASDSTISVLADDAVAAARFLAAQPEIDPARVGLFGLSQGGWIIPLAAVRAGKTVSWALIQSGPAVTQGESDRYADLARSEPFAQAEAGAHAGGPSGFDPAPWIAQLAIPVLWLYGGDDRAQPTGSSLAILHGLAAGHDFTFQLYPDAPHPLFDSGGFAAGLFPAAADWLRGHGLAA